jgi:glutamyl endopeptidase
MPQVLPSETARAPYSAVGLLRMSFSDGQLYGGTGALIENRFVLTCAHNLVNAETGACATAIRFYRAWNSRNQITAATPCQTALCAFSPPEYETTERQPWDIGLVYLNSPCVVTHFFLMQTVKTDASLPRELNLAGYPGNHQGEMWWERDEVDRIYVPHNSLFHLHDSFKGSSGSPVYEYNSDKDEVHLYAVHTHGPNDLKRATLLTPLVVERVQAAINKAKRNAPPGAFTLYKM